MIEDNNRKNIILDFMDPENRILYGTYANYSTDNHVKILGQALNLAVFLCDEYCILPPCAVMQCRIARNTLKTKSSFLDNGLVKFPVRERSLKAFFDKKKQNYEKDKQDEDYSEFFSEDGPAFLLEHTTEIIKRETKVGEAVAGMVGALSSKDPLLAGLYKTLNEDVINSIIHAPTELLKCGEAVSVKGIKRLLSIDCDEDIDFQIGRMLQNKYFYIYIYEYKAQLIYDIPPKTTDFLMEHTDCAYEFTYLRHVLNLFNLYDFIINADSDMIVKLRQLSSYYDFMNALIDIGRISKNVERAKQLASDIYEKSKREMKKPLLIPKNKKLLSETNKKSLYDKISYEFSMFANYYQQYECSEITNTKEKTKPYSSEDIDALKLQLLPCDMNKPFIFIGYNRGDNEIQVYKDCILLGKMGVNYWIDNANMYGGTHNDEGWKTAVNEAIEKCAVYLPYISPGFFDSAPCCEEVNNIMKLNTKAAIVLLIKNGFSIDAVIQKILTYDNILERKSANNMVELFKADGGSDGKGDQYFVNQLRREYQVPYFKHYINDSIFYNTFFKNGIITQVEYPSYIEWRACGEKILQEYKEDDKDYLSCLSSEIS